MSRIRILPLLIFVAALMLPVKLGNVWQGVTEIVTGHLHGGVRQVKITTEISDGRSVALIEKRSTVLDRSYQGGEVDLTVRIGRRQVDELLARGVRMRINGLEPLEALQQEWSVGEPPQIDS